jgi:adenylate cyclase
VRSRNIQTILSSPYINCGLLGGSSMEKQIFVARDRELTQMDGFLKQALANQGLVCLVSGEAGSGKTTLVTEFAHRAQEQHKDLAVAIGQSNAQAGVGDAYLPFREVLGQLTGDVETKLAQGAITKENASRLRKLLVLSCQTLIEVGPDLIGTLVPGGKLVARAGTYVVEKVGWLEKLEKLAGKKREGTEPSASIIEQSQIYEQYVNVLCRLSDKHPLLLILDDLQWADTASIGLLFRMARRIGEHSILLVGTYRPEEVSIGVSGERHPLEKVLSELKRYYGDIWVDLDRAEEEEGHTFVDSLLNTEPNQFGEEFHQKLFQHTGGHPLFTIELLRTMKERGDLIQDMHQCWVETPELNWESLPTRVEGVIEERIGRLGQELRRILTIGSVEGEDFTAEVVARVQSVEARELIQKLSGELERQHHLILPRGVRQLEQGRQRLSLYRFQHNLFQMYLYNELDEAELTYLHEDVGNALEALYGNQVDEIVVQLAQHFDKAGIADKARIYLEKAGRQAANRFANDEAIIHFNRALALTPENRTDDRFSLLLSREHIFGLQGKRELQMKDLTVLQELAQILDDKGKQAEVALQQANYAFITSNYPAAVAAAQEATDLAEAAKDPTNQAKSHLQWGAAAIRQRDYETAHCQLEKALDLSRSAGFRLVEADCLCNLGVISTEQGDTDKAKTYFEESLNVSREIGDRPGEGKALNNLAVVFTGQGDYLRAINYLEEVLAIFHEIGDRRREGISLANLGTLSYSQGDLQASRNYEEQALIIHRESGGRDGEVVTLGNLAVLSAMLGDFAAARCSNEQALLLSREIGRQAEECSILKELGFALSLQGDYTAANLYCEQSLQLARKLGDQQREADALSKLGVIADCIGDYARAQDQYEASLQIARTMGLRPQEGDVLVNLGLLYHHLVKDQPAREYCQCALEISHELGARDLEAFAVTHLGHILVGLNQTTEATDAYQQGMILRRGLGQPHMVMEPLAGLARIRLIQEKPGEAKTFVDEILGFLENHTLDGTEEPIHVYFTCYRVLMANQDKRATEVLSTAYSLVQDRAAKITEEEMRRSYLENVAANREIVQEFTKTG